MKYRNLFTKPFNIILGLFCIAFIGAILFTFNNENFYNKPIGQIIDVKHVSSTPTKDAQNNRDTKYKNQLKVKILNGRFAGETTTINHQYVKSQADSEAFRTHEKVLLHISNKPSDAYIIEKKRDTLTVIITGLFLLTVLLVGRKVGLQSILSLFLNSIAILIAIYIHIQHSNINLFLLMTIAMIGSLGAIMDVAITIASGMHEILQRTPHISMRRWALAGRNIGQDIMGTMTNILLFSYLSGALPMFLIFLKNANTVTYTISMNWSLEIARALTGGIGIVLTIPITILFMEIFETLRRAKQ